MKLLFSFVRVIYLLGDDDVLFSCRLNDSGLFDYSLECVSMCVCEGFKMYGRIWFILLAFLIYRKGNEMCASKSAAAQPFVNSNRAKMSSFYSFEW